MQFVIFIGLTLGCYLVFFLVTAGLMPAISGLSMLEMVNGNLSDPKVLEALKLTQLISTVMVFLLPALIFCYLWSEKPFRYAGLSGRLNITAVVLTILIMVSALPAVGVMGDWNSRLHLTPHLDQYIHALENEAGTMTNAILLMPTFGSFLYSMVIIALVPAIAEEFFFRGVLQRILVKWTHRTWIGIILTGAIFSFAHFEFLGFVPRMALGIIIGVIYAYSGNLWLAVLAHFFNNGSQVILVYLYQLKWIKLDVTKDSTTPWLEGLASVLVLSAFFVLFRKVTAKQQADWKLSIGER
ncbi:MAG TPA: CPBP family intramembrane glutamic endopeptidase [Chitinophagaceae bacterium]|nr:CPBP family intramembrane glutamic endopeptidase [Chitinophagaceae bacterium]